jgi:hypothetical protein
MEPAAHLGKYFGEPDSGTYVLWLLFQAKSSALGWAETRIKIFGLGEFIGVRAS